MSDSLTFYSSLRATNGSGSATSADRSTTCYVAVEDLQRPCTFARVSAFCARTYQNFKISKKIIERFIELGVQGGGVRLSANDFFPPPPSFIHVQRKRSGKRLHPDGERGKRIAPDVHHLRKVSFAGVQAFLRSCEQLLLAPEVAKRNTSLF